MEEQMHANGGNIRNSSLEEMESLWQASKKQE
jgi:uncharacterized protein YabN with tetrapyrrole methylase and pyrophosphatase domain